MVDLVHVQSLTVGLVAGLNMITPTFNLEQSDEHLIIQIHAPYTNAKDTEIDVNNDCVIFYSTPYYLRYVPHHCKQNQNEVLVELLQVLFVYLSVNNC